MTPGERIAAEIYPDDTHWFRALAQRIDAAVEAQQEVDAQIAIAMGKRAQSMRKHGALLGAMLSISESIAEAIRMGKVEAPK